MKIKSLNRSKTELNTRREKERNKKEWIYTPTSAKCKSSIDCAMRTGAQAQLIVVYSQFIEMYTWAYGTIYSWQPEMDLYQSSPPAVFAAILVLYTIAESPLESLLESLFESRLESLLERALHLEE
jgi:hypothetical protein